MFVNLTLEAVPVAFPPGLTVQVDAAVAGLPVPVGAADAGGAAVMARLSAAALSNAVSLLKMLMFLMVFSSPFRAYPRSGCEPLFSA